MENKDKDLLKYMRRLKLFELAICFIVVVAFFAAAITEPRMFITIFSDKLLFILCALLWITLLCTTAFLFYDFYQARSLSEEYHLLHKSAYLDFLTEIPNRHSCDMIFRTYNTPESIHSTGCCLLSIDNLSAINSDYGYKRGDEIICDFTHLLTDAASPYGFFCRNGGNEFLTIFDQCDDDRMKCFLNELQDEIDDYNTTSPDAHIALHSTYVLNSVEEKSSLSQLVASAYSKAKRA